MAKKRNKDVQPVEGTFSDRPRVKKVVQEPVEEPVITPVDEPVEEEIIVEEEPVPESNSSTNTVIKYDEYKVPRGAKENGIILTIILSILILLSLGFLIYYEHSWRLQEEQGTTVVDSKYDELRTVVKGYVGVIHEANKAKYCKQISEIYRKAAKSTDSIEQIEDTILKENRAILGFDNNDGPIVEREYEWQALLSASGIIHTWLTEKGIVVSKDNQREVFTAIAEGFE